MKACIHVSTCTNVCAYGVLGVHLKDNNFPYYRHVYTVYCENCGYFKIRVDDKKASCSTWSSPKGACTCTCSLLSLEAIYLSC